KLPRGDPRHGLRLPRLNGARPQVAPIEVQHDRAVGIVPADRVDLLAHGEARAQLLRQLAGQAGRQLLPGVPLAARELPQPLQVRAAPPLGDEIAARVVADQRGGDVDDERHGGLTRTRAGSSRRSRAWGSAGTWACAASTTWRRSP